ncbi:MAG: hypothetical protein KDK39_16000 [Leptospiraceae bacterium]|nr:hypothetical protein [Leptospiraceae bacterium]
MSRLKSGPGMKNSNTHRGLHLVMALLCSCLAWQACTVKDELSGENDNEVQELLKILKPIQDAQQLLKGLTLLERWKNLEQAYRNGTTTTESDNSYPGTTPVSNSQTGACYVDNRGEISGFDLCCYNLAQSECADLVGVLFTGYDITFLAGSNTASACTGQGFTTAYNDGTYFCYFK